MRAERRRRRGLRRGAPRPGIVAAGPGAGYCVGVGTVRGATTRVLVGGRADRLVREEPLALVVGQARVLTVRTPGDADEDRAFALGFLVSEAVVARADDVRGLSTGRGEDGVCEVRVELRAGAEAVLAARAYEIRPSCGLCGATGDEALQVDGPPLAAGRPTVSLPGLSAMVDHMRARQRVFEETGACHAAALFAPDGRMLGIGEDVGRHNALDKALGRALMAGADPTGAVAVLSGRAGYELVAKLVRVGTPIIASVSAPTALAFDLCKEAGATLVGFVRRGSLGTVYWDAGRIRPGGGEGGSTLAPSGGVG